jgi:translation initiation factor IF-3
MAELFGRVDGVCKGRGGSMHMFDLERRFMGGYGIVGGNLPISAGFALSSDYQGTDDVTLCQFGDGASNQGTFGETLNLAALWHLPVVFMVTNNRFGMGTALERHSAVTDLQRKGEGFGVPGMECDGMDVLDTYMVTQEALRMAREQELDLVEVAPTAKPPVCRIMDFGKFLYQQKKKAHESKRKQKIIHVKEVKFRPNIDEHDYDFKLKNAVRFLEEGDKVKATVQFRGREMARQDLGHKLIQRLAQDLGERGVLESSPEMAGNRMHVIFGQPRTAVAAPPAAKKPDPAT